jgi:hypothetical protein
MFSGRYNYLDWFHITMRLTVMGQYGQGLDTTQGRRVELSSRWKT